MGAARAQTQPLTGKDVIHEERTKWLNTFVRGGSGIS